MDKTECPRCSGAAGNGLVVCEECGKKIGDTDNENTAPPTVKRSRKNIYLILAILLAAAGGLALLIFTGLLPNPLGNESLAAIVNGEKITLEELDQKLDVYKSMNGQGGKMDFSSSKGKAALDRMRLQILDNMIQEKVLVLEARKEKITVDPPEIAERMTLVKKALNLSDQDFEAFLKNHAMSLADFEKRVENDAFIAKLLAKGIQERGLTKDALVDEINARAKVEVLIK